MLVRWIHLLAAAVWTGGLITLAALVPTMRNAGAERSQLQAVARQFGRLSWVAMGLAVVTGVLQLIERSTDAASRAAMGPALALKLGLVGLAVALALGHQLTASRTSPAVRGITQGLILLVSIGIFGAAVSL